MPLTYNDALDDPLIFDGSPNFSGGAEMQADPSQLQPIQCAELINCVHTRIGDVQTRNGTSKLGSAALAASKIQGLGELDTSSIERILAAVNGAMQSWNGSAWSTASGYTPSTASVPVEIIQGVNLLFVADGVQNMRSWDGTTFTDLGTGGTAPPLAKYIAWHTNRMFAVTDNSDDLDISSVLPSNMATAWDSSTRRLKPGGGSGGPITCIGGWTDFYFLVFKYNSHFLIIADPSVSVTNWEIRQLSDRIGSVAHRTGKMVGNDFFFLSRDGIRSVLRTQVDKQGEVSLPISWPIQPIIDRINWSYAYKSCAEYIDNKYLCAVPLDTATEPNTVLVYDTRLKTWSGYWTGWTPTIFLVSKLSELKKFYFGQTDGKVLKWNFDADTTLESTFLDDGSAIATTMLTKSYQYNEIFNPKSGWNVELEFNKSLATVTLSAILDQSPQAVAIEQNFASYGSTNQLPVNLPFDLARLSIHRKAFDLFSQGEFREIQFKVTATTGKVALKQLTTSAFLNTMKYQQ